MCTVWHHHNFILNSKRPFQMSTLSSYAELRQHKCLHSAMFLHLKLRKCSYTRNFNSTSKKKFSHSLQWCWLAAVCLCHHKKEENKNARRSHKSLCTPALCYSIIMWEWDGGTQVSFQVHDKQHSVVALFFHSLPHDSVTVVLKLVI